MRKPRLLIDEELKELSSEEIDARIDDLKEYAMFLSEKVGFAKASAIFAVLLLAAQIVSGYLLGILNSL